MEQEKIQEIKDSFTRISKSLSLTLDSLTNPAFWVLENLNKNLFDNQIEIVEAINNLNEKNIAILQARGAGKSFAVAIGLIKLCLDHRDFSIGIFAPREKQAERIIEEIRRKIAVPGTWTYKQIDWKNSVKSRLFFKNGSEITALSGDETSQQEGWHFNCVVIDEAHRIRDSVMTERISPMLGTLPYAKTIKLGIAVGKNNFYKSCNSPNYKTFIRDWTQCPALLTAGSIFYKGKEYPSYVVERLPLSIKKKLFPDRPDLHYDSTEGYTELEYYTQYAMEWSDDIFLELNREQQARLASGDFDILEEGRPHYNERYFFGLDTAPGSLTPGKKDLDFTALSIWRLQSNGIKEKVKCYEWQGDIVEQLEEIKYIITKKFKCVFGLADYSNIAQGSVEFWKKAGIAVEGIMFKKTDSNSGKNMKNAMFDEFSFELSHDRIKYPTKEILDKDVVFKKSYNEWCSIERHKKTGINDQIEAPSDLHDDHCCSDVLAVWAMDKADQFPIARHAVHKMPKPLLNQVQRVYNRGIDTGNRENRYLK